ncbi:heme-binding protein [bacterium]|nr:heme-binding protein [bacterium]
MAIEIPKYEVLVKADDFEVRHYDPYIVAETVVDGDFDSASTKGFKRLAGYIFGGNQSKKKISMTAPVGMKEKSSEKIAMTAPVAQEKRNGKYVVTFSMPSSYTMETLPTPDDENVALRAVPEKTFATVQFNGTWSSSRYEDHLSSLRDWIKKQGYESVGEPNFARYDPPWTLWFLRRNEILIEIKRPATL